VSVRLADITRRALRERMADGLDTAIIPLGATEQHGEALPFGTDTVIGELVAERLAERVGAVVTPALPFGCSHEHLSVPGTMTLDAATMIAVVTEVGVSLARNGFSTLVLVVAHFGNRAPAELAARQIVEATGAVVGVSSYLAGIEHAVLERLGHPADAVDWSAFYSHAGAVEAALVMARDPGLVDLEHADAHPPDRAVTLYDPAMTYPGRVEEAAPPGMWGDPTRVSETISDPPTAEMGEAILDVCADQLAVRLHRMVAEVRAARADLPPR
jgi:creatinine amidohydrolase